MALMNDVFHTHLASFVIIYLDDNIHPTHFAKIQVFRQEIHRFLFKLALNQMAMTCSDVTTIDVSDVQQMSQMADVSEV
jgi:hypothetical protein